MPTIDLSTPSPAASGLLEGLPRRLSFTLPELRLLAERAGGAPLPFESVEASAVTAFDDRLGQSRGSAEDQAYAAALATLHDPTESLARRGLLDDDHELLGAIGLLAKPEVAVDIDVTAGNARARSWHRLAGEAVATLSTVDGLVFELGWLGAEQWPAELARVPALPEDCGLLPSEVPVHVSAPFELVDAACEATRSGRSDLLGVLAAQHDGAVLGDDGSPLPTAEAITVLGALTTECRGRLRALVADVSGEQTQVVGVVSWALLADGWHALRPRRTGDAHRLEVCAVSPVDLATELAPVLAEVTA